MLTCRNLPFLIFHRKLCCGEMAKDAGHRNGTISPWWIKCEIELVVLDVLITSDIMLESYMRRVYDIAGLCFNLTV